MGKLMGRLLLFIATVVVATSLPGEAQLVPPPGRDDARTPWGWGPSETESDGQEPPVYLKSLTSGRDRKLESAENLETDPSVDETINRVGRSFESGDAAELERCLVTGKRKIFLSLELGDEKRGHYGPGQVRHIFDRLFRDVESRRFTYDAREIERQNGSVVFRADWEYVVLDTDEEVTERLQFTLEKDKSDWRIFEIRATR